MDDVQCGANIMKNIAPDPRDDNLNDGFIYVEQKWGSLFYKHIGKQTISEAQKLCSFEGPSVHLPMPRFYEENEFYKTHFGHENLWLDVFYNPLEGVKNANEQWLIRYIERFIEINKTNTTSETFAEIKYHEWINFAGGHAEVDGEDEFNGHSEFDGQAEFNGHAEFDGKDELAEADFKSKVVFMKNNGEWDWTDENVLFDAVCVYDMTPDEKSCSRCQNDSVCRYKTTDNSRSETECVCQKTSVGFNCEIDLCSHCQNGGYCDFSCDFCEIQCICPYPFHGENCESNYYDNPVIP